MPVFIVAFKTSFPCSFLLINSSPQFSLSFQRSKKEEFNTNCQFTIYVISCQEFQVYRVIQALVVQVFGFSLYPFLGETSFLITPLLEVRQEKCSEELLSSLFVKVG